MLSNVVLSICLKAIDFGWVQNAELHHFADASQIAYGDCVIARLVNENGRTHCSFLTGKSRSAHVKQMAIPRLELSAAVSAVRRISVKIWHDSVLIRLHSRPPIFQEQRQTILHVCGQSPGSDTSWLMMMMMILHYEESVEIRHDVVRFLFPSLPVEIQVAPTDISDQQLNDAGLATYVERTKNANGNRCRIVQLTFRLLLSKSPSFYNESKKLCRPVERLRVVFRKKYLANTLWVGRWDNNKNGFFRSHRINWSHNQHGS